MAEDPEFKKAMEMSRPGVGAKLLTERSLAGTFLEKEHGKIDEQMRSRLQGMDLVLSQDGWSNVHQEPIIATCVHIPGHTFFHDAVDVGEATKDAQYCAELAKASIESAEEKYGCRVVGLFQTTRARWSEFVKYWRDGVGRNSSPMAAPLIT